MAEFNYQNIVFDLDFSEYSVIFSKYIPQDSEYDARGKFIRILGSDWHTIEPVNISKTLPQININDKIYTAQDNGAKITFFIRNWVCFESNTINTVEGSPVISDVLSWNNEPNYDQIWQLLGINPIYQDINIAYPRYGLISGSNYNQDFNIGNIPEVNLTGLDNKSYADAFFSFNQYLTNQVSETIDEKNYTIIQLFTASGFGSIGLNNNMNNFSSPLTGGAPTFSSISCEVQMPQVITFADNELFATNQLFKRILINANVQVGSSWQHKWFELILGLKSY